VIQCPGNTQFNAIDRLAIINLINSYGFFIDQGRVTDFIGLFTDHPVIEIWHGENKIVSGWEQFKQTATERQARFRSEGVQRRHVLSPPRFDSQDDRSAAGQVYLRLYSIAGQVARLVSIGFYEFTVVKIQSQSQWKLHRWIAHVDAYEG
jgi:hypothetical protein